MPELPEVESARAVIEHGALGRLIADVDDSDTYECRPHRPGEIQVLWQAKIHPAGPVGELAMADVDRLSRAVRRSVESSVANGGVHTLPMLSFRQEDSHCPRCGALMMRGKVAGRTTWWCSREQFLA